MEGYAFTIDVAYEWLPDFGSHCQNIGHDVTACRRLYPWKETIMPKEQITQGRKQVPTKKVTWVPINDNPSYIDSSLAFGPMQQNVSQLLIVEEETKTVPQSL